LGKARGRIERARAYVSLIFHGIVILLYAGFLTLILLVEFLHIHLPGDAALVYYVSVVASMIMALSVHIVVLYNRLRKTQIKQTAEIKQMREALRSGAKLFTLEEAVRDMRSHLAKMKPDQKVAIDHLGLHLGMAWDKLWPSLERFSATHPVEYRLLMLREDLDRAASLPADVTDWMAIARRQKPKIERRLAKLRAASNGRLKADLRFYCDLPVIHGFRVRQPINVAYVAISRWIAEDEDQGKYDEFNWGGHEYHRVIEPLVEVQGDLIAVFDGYFCHHWESNRP